MLTNSISNKGEAACWNGRACPWKCNQKRGESYTSFVSKGRGSLILSVAWIGLAAVFATFWLLPSFLSWSIWIKLDSKGPVIVTNRARDPITVGSKIWKFRNAMVTDADKEVWWLLTIVALPRWNFIRHCAPWMNCLSWCVLKAKCPFCRHAWGATLHQAV